MLKKINISESILIIVEYFMKRIKKIKKISKFVIKILFKSIVVFFSMK